MHFRQHRRRYISILTKKSNKGEMVPSLKCYIMLCWVYEKSEIFLRMYGPLAQRLLFFPPWFVGSLVYQATLAPVGLNLVASDFHAENKQRKQNRDNMALLSSSTRFGFSVQLLDLSVCKWICMSLKGFHYQVSILDLHRMATECWTTCSCLARKYRNSLAPPFPPVHIVAEKRGVMARFIDVFQSIVNHCELK